MNIYLCSTVRNLLFALLKSLNEPEQNSHILMICDQQNIDINNYNAAAIPPYIGISFINRADIRKRLDSRLSGRIFRLVAAANINTNEGSRQKMRAFIFEDILKETGLTADGSKQLFLFNDRNRIARLLRLGFADYTIIEDGLSNYSGQKLKLTDRIQHMLSGVSNKLRYVGDDKRCKEIFLLNPEKAPQVLQSKVKPVTFINNKNIADYCYAFFRFQPTDSQTPGFSHLIATQPIAVGELTASGFDLVIYKKILNYLGNKGENTAIKVHPRENVDRYKRAFPGHQLMESKIPLELLIFGAADKCDVISIFSTAGMGFEQYCRRLTLVKDAESEQMAAVFAAWREDETLLDKRIDSLLR